MNRLIRWLIFASGVITSVALASEPSFVATTTLLPHGQWHPQTHDLIGGDPTASPLQARWVPKRDKYAQPTESEAIAIAKKQAAEAKRAQERADLLAKRAVIAQQKAQYAARLRAQYEKMFPRRLNGRRICPGDVCY
jgi:hypothetical protein